MLFTWRHSFDYLPTYKLFVLASEQQPGLFCRK